MSNTHNRHAHAKALRARQRADGHSQFRFASGVLLASAVAGALMVGALTTSPEQAHEIGGYAVADLSAFLLEDMSADPAMTITWQGQQDRTGAKEWAAFQPLRDEAVMDLLRKSGEFFVMKEDLDDQTEAANEGI